MHVSTRVRRVMALGAAGLAAAACAEAPSAPHAADRRPGFYDDAARLMAADRGQADAHRQNDDARSRQGEATLVIDPRVAKVYAFGAHWIYFPAYSICDPATAGYDVAQWDAPCAPLTKPVTITVRWSSKGGHAYAEFAPDLRFVPASHPHAGWCSRSANTSRWAHPTTIASCRRSRAAHGSTNRWPTRRCAPGSTATAVRSSGASSTSAAISSRAVCSISTADSSAATDAD